MYAFHPKAVSRAGRQRRRNTGPAICLAATAVIIFAEAAGEPAPRIAYGPGRELAKLACRAINESSGLAAGRKNPGAFWTHNDSGTEPVLYAFNTEGEDLATLRIEGAAARDWEDMASFSYEGRNYLLIGDVGDNASKRPGCALYLISEPEVDPAQRGQVLNARVLQTINFHYEDGPHNCESLAIDPGTRKIYFVSKTSGNACKVYELERESRPAQSDRTARPIASLNIPTVTAMDISSDGLRAIVLTYGNAYEYVRRPGESWADGFASAPREIQVPRRAQGESICYGLDGATLYLTSECKDKNSANPSPLIEVPVASGAKAGSRLKR